MNATSCQRCGASVTIPAELTALEMSCTFCGNHQPVPDAARRQQLLWEKQRQDQIQANVVQVTRGAFSMGKWIMIGVFVFTGLIMAIVIFSIVAATSFAVTNAPGAGAGAKKPFDVDSAKQNGSKLVKKEIAGKKQDGCRTLKHPEVETYDADVTASGLTIPKGHCFSLSIATGTDTQLTYVLHDPNGKKVDSMSGKEMFTHYCASKELDGGYEFTISTESGAPYSYAELECPKD